MRTSGFEPSALRIVASELVDASYSQSVLIAAREVSNEVHSNPPGPDD